MPTPPLTDEECLRAVAAYHRHHRSHNRAAADLGIKRCAFQRRLKKAAERGFMGFRPVLPGFAVSETSVQRDAAGNVQKEWVRQRKEHGDVFAVPEGHAVKGISALVDPEGRTIAQWIKTREDAEENQKLISAIKAEFADHQPIKIIAPPAQTLKDLATVYAIGDHHLGLYAWGKETGGADYNLDEGARLLKDAMRNLVSGVPQSNTGVVLNLGDFVHADNASNRTAQSGNALDVDTRYAKVLQVGVDLLISCVEMAAKKHKRVVVRCLPGNHDAHTALALSVALQQYFSATDRITVDCSPSPFWSWQFGKVLLAANHGDMVKPADMPGVMAAKWPEEWGKSKYRYAYFGHVHHRSKGGGELHGVVWETFQTLAAPDAWHSASGYSSGRSMTAITHHKDRGEIMRHTVQAL